MDPYAGLSKVNTPLHTPLRLSLKEWSTEPSPPHQENHYRLFAVVMHSGVTISSGHYTTYIRMMDLHLTEIERHAKTGEPRDTAAPDYDDGEVSFSLSSKTNESVTGGSGKPSGPKRGSDGVGLLGGQRSLSNYEIGTSKQATSGCSPVPARKGAAVKEKVDGVKEESHVTEDSALQNLLEYEGKWMLFDDSEVRLVPEEDFLRACSPETCSTSTPYLLFYKKVTGDMD